MPNRLSGRSPSSTLPLTYMPPYWLFFPPCFPFPTWFIMPLWQSTPKPPRMCNHCTYLPRPSSARTSHDPPWRPAPVRAYRIDSDSTRTFILFRLNVLQYKSRTKPQYPTHPPHTVSRLRPPNIIIFPGRLSPASPRHSAYCCWSTHPAHHADCFALSDTASGAHPTVSPVVPSETCPKQRRSCGSSSACVQPTCCIMMAHPYNLLTPIRLQPAIYSSCAMPSEGPLGRSPATIMISVNVK